jgi:exopolysaccharide biosynthesis polyprenyl glycosylphosphotransferase
MAEQARGPHALPPVNPKRSALPLREAPTSLAINRLDNWRPSYARRLFFTDLVVLAVTMATALLLRFGDPSEGATLGGFVSVSYIVVAAAIASVWWVALAVFGTRDPKIVGQEDTDEYARITRATVLVFGWIAIVSLLFKWDLSRGFLALAFPLGLAGLLIGRRSWRGWLSRQRGRGLMHSRVLVIGGPRSAKIMSRSFLRNRNGGYRVSGVWVPDRPGHLNEWLDLPNSFVPVLGTNRSLADALAISEADTVIVTDTEHLGSEGLNALAWQLEGSDIDLMVSPNMVDVAGPRIHVRAVSNMPFIHLEEPQYAGAGGLGKKIFDKVFAAVFLACASPILIAAALAIKIDSRGPVLYRSERIGVGGVPFSMLKFRSMRRGADEDVDELREQDQGAGPLFKLRSDPRVTRVGAFLRRYSIDEFPQFVNVLKGEMSVVGPRPPLRSEVEMYDGFAGRRLLVKQGITGLWQVSGRSNLTWEETVRLDLDYVENWSMVRDLQIIWRTVRAVVTSAGAY